MGGEQGKRKLSISKKVAALLALLRALLDSKTPSQKVSFGRRKYGCIWMNLIEFQKSVWPFLDISLPVIHRDDITFFGIGDAEFSLATVSVPGATPRGFPTHCLTTAIIHRKTVWWYSWPNKSPSKTLVFFDIFWGGGCYDITAVVWVQKNLIVVS